MIVTNCLDLYFEMMRTHKECFFPCPAFPIVTDRKTIEEYERMSGVKIGVLYQSPYYTLVVDLIEKDGKLFPYERMIPTAKGKAVVCVPVLDGKLVLVKQQRHAIRGEQIAFPRGFGEDGLSPEENAKKELREEIGAEIIQCIELGTVYADSGLLSTDCRVFLCHIASFDPKAFCEGITEAILLHKKALQKKILDGEITDGFTLSAMSLLRAKNDLWQSI